MKLQYILEIFIICRLFCYRVFHNGNMGVPFDFGKEILIIQEFTKMGFSYFGGFMHLVCDNLIVYYSLVPVLVIWYAILGFFWKLNGTFLN